MDFTLKRYQYLIDTLKQTDYTFQTFKEYLLKPANRVIILRHDVEARYPNALFFARIQNQLQIKGSYYFRFLKNHYDSDIIKQIANLGHEIGYHYDDLSHTHGDYTKAINRFQANLKKLKNIAPVSTICMEGAPASKYDNRDLWKQFNYKDFGIIGEPYFDLNFNEVYYISDTGRSWRQTYSVRDKVDSNFKQGTDLSSTLDMILAFKQNKLPDRIMITFHPQRWNDNTIPWIWELFFQNVKNQLKAFLIKQKDAK